jgi:2-keto-4-pentenoate hydratase
VIADPDRRLAEALVEVRRAQNRQAHGGPRFEGLDPALFVAPRDAAGAYAVQQAVAHELGWFASGRASAWKVGAPARDATPEATPLPPAGVVESPATLAAGAFTSIGIEGEVAFRLRDPSGSTDDAIGEIVVTIEIVAPRFRDLAAMPALLRLADQGVHGALVVGSGIAWRGPIDWARQVAVVRRNGITVAETRGGHPLGDLRYLVAWLARHAASRGYPLAAGDLVTAGTWTGLVPARAGEVVSVAFPGIGEASVALT